MQELSKERMYVNWHDVELHIKVIVDHMVLSGAKPEVILAVGAGGLIPASMIAYQFGKRTARIPLVDVIYATSYHGERRGSVNVVGMVDAIERLPRHSNQILIVDDMVDSGSTLEHFLAHFSQAHTAVLVYKGTSSVKPDYCGHVDKEGDRYWYVFPWER